MRSVLPPRKKDWKRGSIQIGLFYRGASGVVLELTVNDADEDERAAAVGLILAISREKPEKK